MENVNARTVSVQAINGCSRTVTQLEQGVSSASAGLFMRDTPTRRAEIYTTAGAHCALGVVAKAGIGGLVEADAFLQCRNLVERLYKREQAFYLGRLHRKAKLPRAHEVLQAGARLPQQVPYSSVLGLQHTRTAHLTLSGPQHVYATRTVSREHPRRMLGGSAVLLDVHEHEGLQSTTHARCTLHVAQHKRNLD
jgi:hypothetical protein